MPNHFRDLSDEVLAFRLDDAEEHAYGAFSEKRKLSPEDRQALNLLRAETRRRELLALYHDAYAAAHGVNPSRDTSAWGPGDFVREVTACEDAADRGTSAPL